MADLAGGTLTFVFSDIEGSTRLVRELGASYGRLLADYQRFLREAFSRHGGREVDATGDSFFAAFARPRDAVLAAAAAQRALVGHDWPSGVELRARIGVHTGPAELDGSRYVGVAVHRAARLCAAGNGGQVLVSQATVALLEDEQALPALELHDLGEQRLKDFDRAVRVYRLAGSGLPDDPRPLRGGAPPLPALRAADADREQAVAALREHTAAGRLTLEEFSERAERAYAATTLPDLEEVARDLPAAAEVPVPAERPRRRPKRFTGVAFGNTQRTGRWRLARRGVVFVFFGDADLDLRQAELSGSVASITAFVLFGNVDVYVPEGIEVDLGGLALIGHRREWGRDLPPHPGTPLLRVRILSLFGTADLWRVPAAWVGRSFREVIKSMRRGAHPELPPP